MKIVYSYFWILSTLSGTFPQNILFDAVFIVIGLQNPPVFFVPGLIAAEIMQNFRLLVHPRKIDLVPLAVAAVPAADFRPCRRRA